jgi:hypothetical protein
MVYTPQRHASLLCIHYLNLNRCSKCCRSHLLVFLVNTLQYHVAFSGDHLYWATDPVIDHGLGPSRTRKAAKHNSVWDL